jgi:hypothetical protein
MSGISIDLLILTCEMDYWYQRYSVRPDLQEPGKINKLQTWTVKQVRYAFQVGCLDVRVKRRRVYGLF